MNKLQNTFLYYILSIIVLGGIINCHGYNLSSKLENNKLILNLSLDKDEVLLNNSFKLSSQNPKIKLKRIIKETEGELTSYTNTDTNKKEDVYKDKVKLVYDIDIENINTNPIEFLASFKTNKSNIQEIIKLNLIDDINDQKEISNTYKNKDLNNNAKIKSDKNGCIPRFTNYWKTNLTSLFKDTGSSWIRYLATFTIGVLLSLTPCIYPMIPITVGIIQATGRTSFIGNFLVSLCYTLGVSLTFATFGFITALGSCAFGQLQTSPWFIIPLVIILTYLGLSMFGLYDMYVPRFLQAKTSNVKKGSIVSAFIFGAISGTVASPCLSPGLALILSYVMEISKSGNISAYLEGFSLLFVFGIGSSMPLLLVGTFSNSLEILPKAGQWMIEVKKLLGLMLLGMCLYYLKMILPLFLVLWILAIGLFIISIYYFWNVQHYDSKYTRYYKNIMGLIFMILSFLVSINAYKSTHNYIYNKKNISKSTTTQAIKTKWYTNLENAKKIAQDQGKHLFIDFYTEACYACEELDKNTLSSEKITTVLNNYYVPMKVNDSDKSNDAFNRLKKYIPIIGFPTIVIYDIKSNKVIKQWSGADISIEELEQELIQNRKQ